MLSKVGATSKRRSHRHRLDWERMTALARLFIPYPRELTINASLSRYPLRRQSSRHEPYAVIPHVRICAGGGG